MSKKSNELFNQWKESVLQYDIEENLWEYVVEDSVYDQPYEDVHMYTLILEDIPVGVFVDQDCSPPIILHTCLLEPIVTTIYKPIENFVVKERTTEDGHTENWGEWELPE